MENTFTLAVLLVAVVCVLAATRPTRPAARPRQAPPDRKQADDPPGPPGANEPEPGIRVERRTGALRRWDRLDLARALAVELVAPGAEGESWPTRR